MNFLSNAKLGTRLGVGFAAVLALMVLMITLAVIRFDRIGESSEKIIRKDWVKADAIATVNATTRANARRTMELFFATDKAQLERIRESIAANKTKISEALATLESL